MTKKINLIPVLTTTAGRCLTEQNWQETGVHCVSYSLESLLIKPGFAYLKTLPNMAAYFPWSGDWVLNATMSVPLVKEKYKLSSPYDGLLLSYTIDEIVEIILHLKPPLLVLPEGYPTISNEFLEKAQVFVSANDLAQYPRDHVRGIYYHDGQEEKVLNSIIRHQAEFPGVQQYVSGRLDLTLIKHLVSLGVSYLESDFPASQACEGNVYCHEGLLDLKDDRYSQQFEVIDSNCHCPTCEQKFSRAYLHYLLGHTPLLCQRLLIQHNVYYCLY